MSLIVRPGVSTVAKVDFYGGMHPGDVACYSVTEAAHHLRLPTGTVRSWVMGRSYPVRAGRAAFPPLVTIADSAHKLLSFRNLVELHVLSSIRRTHGVKVQAVRRAIKYLEKELDSRHPLLDRQMLTDGKDLFVNRYGQLVNISQHGQMEMKQVLSLYLKRIEWNKDVPIRLFPFTRQQIEHSPRIISIDPRIRFGSPCIANSGIPTAIIAERLQAGESIAFLADDYGRTIEEIEEAIRYEGRIAS